MSVFSSNSDSFGHKHNRFQAFSPYISFWDSSETLPVSLFPSLYFFGPTLMWTFFSGRQIFNNHWLDLYAECVRTICPVPSSIFGGTGYWNFKVVYSPGYYPDILLGENWPRRLSLKPPDSVICETWASSSCPSLNASMSFKHPALLELPRKVLTASRKLQHLWSE